MGPDKLKHRGKLTRALIHALTAKCAAYPDLAFGEFIVTFRHRGLSSPLVRMPALAALHSVTYDIATCDQFNWSNACEATVSLRDNIEPDFVDLAFASLSTGSTTN